MSPGPTPGMALPACPPACLPARPPACLPIPARGRGAPGARHSHGRPACPQPLCPRGRARWVIPRLRELRQHLPMLNIWRPRLSLGPSLAPPGRGCARGWGSSAPRPRPAQGRRRSDSSSHMSPKQTCPQKPSPARKQLPVVAAAPGSTVPGLGELMQRGRWAEHPCSDGAPLPSTEPRPPPSYPTAHTVGRLQPTNRLLPRPAGRGTVSLPLWGAGAGSTGRGRASPRGSRGGCGV